MLPDLLLAIFGLHPDSLSTVWIEIWLSLLSIDSGALGGVWGCDPLPPPKFCNIFTNSRY